MNLWVQEDYVHVEGEKATSLGKGEPYETRFEHRGELYRACRRDFGRCVSRVYVDGPTGNPRPVGWVFRKKTADSAPGLQETWVTVFSRNPIIPRQLDQSAYA